jgi:hypothetical protein
MPRPAGRRPDGHDGKDLTCTSREDDVTEPGFPNDVPDADALEQQLSARPGEAGTPSASVGGREADDADLLEQSVEVPLDDEHDR